jgi:hypothetical protein
VTAEDFAKQLRAEIVAAGGKTKNIKVFADFPAKDEGIYVKAQGNQFKLIYMSQFGPKRIPSDVRDVLMLVLPKLSPGVTTQAINTIEYGRSSDTLRRAQTLRSILRSALESDPALTKERIKNLKIDPTAPAAVVRDGKTTYEQGAVDPERIRAELARTASTVTLVECLDPGESGFPRHPTLADLSKISVMDAKGIPKVVTFVRMTPPPPTRTVIMSEARVGDHGKRADAVSLSYKLSDAELKHVKNGVPFDMIPATDRVAVDPYLHIGDTNRPLEGAASADHVAKTIEYGKLTTADIVNQAKALKLSLEGKLVISLSDTRQFSPGLLFDPQDLTIKAVRDLDTLANDDPKASKPPVTPIGPQDPGTLKALHLVLETQVQNGQLVVKSGVVHLLRENVPVEVMTLENFAKAMPHAVPAAVADLVKTLKALKVK